jgi:hypothetical protein
MWTSLNGRSKACCASVSSGPRETIAPYKDRERVARKRRLASKETLINGVQKVINLRFLVSADQVDGPSIT